MSGQIQGDDLVFRVVIDDADLPRATASVSKGLQNVASQANVGQQQFAKLSKSTALTRQEMMALNYTASDIAASLSSGASPFTILLQQGGQVKDSFGGLGPLFSKLSSVLTVARVAFGLTAAAAAGVVYALYEGHQRTEEFNKSIVLTGNFAGVAAGEINTLARSVAALSQAPIGASREALMALIKTGQVGPQALQPMAQAMVTLQKTTGGTADEIAKDFAGMSTGVAKWAYEHNRLLHFVTAEQYTYIRSLEAQGKVQEAMAFTSQVLDKALKDRQPGLSAIGKLWKEVGDFASSAWDKMAGIGKTDNVAQQIDGMKDKLVQVQRELQSARSRRAGDTEIGALEAAEKRLKGFLEANRAAGRLGSKEQAEKAEQDRQELERAQSGFIEAGLSKERAGIAQSRATQDLARERERLSVERQYDLLEISGQTYLERVTALERAQIAAKEAAVNDEIALEAKRPVGTPQEAIAREAKLIELQTKRVVILGERAKLEDRIRRGELYRPGPQVLETPNQQFLRMEHAEGAALEAGLRDRAAQRTEAAHELLDANRDLGIQLVLDDRQRGLAQIAVEEETLRKRLDLDALNADDRKRVEASLATWRVLREKQLTEELKPEYQKQLDLFADTARYMKQASDEFHQGFIDRGRDAFAQWVETGKASSAGLVSFIKQQFAKLVYDKYLAGIFNSLAGSFFDSFKGLGGGSGGGGGGGDWMQETMSLIGIHHAGGIAGAPSMVRSVSSLAFAGAPRYHGGGIAGDEVPAILRRGEEVLTESNPRHVKNGAGRAPVSITYAPVTYVDSRSDQMQIRRIAAEQNELGRRQLLDDLRAQGVL